MPAELSKLQVLLKHLDEGREQGVLHSFLITLEAGAGVEPRAGAGAEAGEGAGVEPRAGAGPGAGEGAGAGAGAVTRKLLTPPPSEGQSVV